MKRRTFVKACLSGAAGLFAAVCSRWVPTKPVEAKEPEPGGELTEDEIFQHKMALMRQFDTGLMRYWYERHHGLKKRPGSLRLSGAVCHWDDNRLR